MNKIFFIFFLMNSLYGFSQKKELGVALKNKNYQQAILLGHQLLVEKPNNFEVILGLSMAYNGSADVKNARIYSEKLEKIAREDWEYCWAFVELMKANFALGNEDISKKYYQKAKNVKGTINAEKTLDDLGKLFGFDSFYDQWKIVETENIIFHFEGSIDKKFLDDIIQTRQDSYTKINIFFNSKLPKKIDFFVWNSKNSYNKFLDENLGFAKPIYCITHNRLNQSFGHEISHNISFWSGDQENKVRNEFINEGIAVYFDQNGNDKLKIARDVYKVNQIDIKETWKENLIFNEDIVYPISGAFVQYLIEYDKDKLLKLNDRQDYENAEKIYGSEIDRLIMDFTDLLKK